MTRAHSRRSFLKGLSAATGASVMTTSFGGLLRNVAYASAPTGNVLVLLSLRGGADGLSMVVPYGDPNYAPARPRLAVPKSSLCVTDGFFGLHGAFEPLAPMWRRGRVAAVHAVGLPVPNRSHFAATDVWETGDMETGTTSGWLNRLIGLDDVESCLEATHFSSPIVPRVLFGPSEALALEGIRGIGLPGKTETQAGWRRAALNELWADDDGALGRGGRSALFASEALKPLADDLPEPENGAVYPKTELGDALADTARLIRGGYGTEVITLEFGGWDHHVDLGEQAEGQMKEKISELALAIAAFYKDLGALESKVTVLTASEFGRRVKENGDLGLDHGYGGMMLLVGGDVRGGRTYADWPGLADSKLVEGDVKVTRDYRSVLSEVLRSKFNPNLARVFPGFNPEPPLGLFY